jgi:hypothetical protein
MSCGRCADAFGVSPLRLRRSGKLRSPAASLRPAVDPQFQLERRRRP